MSSKVADEKETSPVTSDLTSHVRSDGGEDALQGTNLLNGLLRLWCQLRTTGKLN